MNLASVVIIHYRQNELTHEVLRSLDRHQRATPVEVIVVDNGSAEPYHPPQLAGLQPRVVRLDAGVGFGSACQAGAGAAAPADTPIVILNNDLSFQDDLVGGLLEAGRAHPDAG